MKLSLEGRPNVSLVKPDVRYEQSFRSGFAELETQSDKFSWIYLGESSYEKYFAMEFPEYVRTLRQRETEPPPNFVCDTVYWALSGDDVVGRISIRHELTEFLKRIGGHIGYIVRPSARGKGVATEMLRQILCTERARTIGNLLVTCDEGNQASERTIIKCGGVLQDKITVDAAKPRKQRFWIRQSAHFIFYVKDQSKSTEFYSRVLAADPSLNVPGMSEFTLPGGAILGLMPEDGIKRLLGEAIQHPKFAQGVARSELYLRVSSPGDYHARALAAGALELSPLQERNWGDTAAYSADIDGYVLAFATHSQPTNKF